MLRTWVLRVGTSALRKLRGSFYGVYIAPGLTSWPSHTRVPAPRGGEEGQRDEICARAATEARALFRSCFGGGACAKRAALCDLPSTRPRARTKCAISWLWVMWKYRTIKLIKRVFSRGFTWGYLFLHGISTSGGGAAGSSARGHLGGCPVPVGELAKHARAHVPPSPGPTPFLPDMALALGWVRSAALVMGAGALSV